MNTIMTRFKSLRPCPLDEGILSTGRAKQPLYTEPVCDEHERSKTNTTLYVVNSMEILIYRNRSMPARKCTLNILLYDFQKLSK